MATELLKDAIVEANQLKGVAEENAKIAIEEFFQPKIQRMISSKLAEEDDEYLPDEDLGIEDEFAEEPPVDTAPPAEAPLGDEFAEEEPFEDEFAEEPFKEEKYIDDGADGTPADNLKEEDLEEDFDTIIRELESELDDGDNIEEADDLQGTEGFDDDLDDDLDDLNIESLIRTLEEEEFGKVQEEELEEDEATDLKAENEELKAEIAEAYRVITTLKGTMNEVNLLNSKLMFSSKIMQAFDLTEGQQVKILETFDRAKNLREVKLIYATIQENYRAKETKKPIERRRRKPVRESASRTVVADKGGKKEQFMEGYERNQVLAGLRKLED